MLQPGYQTASMAAKHLSRQGFLLLIFHFISSLAAERRFSDFKRCADEECSMLLCRGKAVQDFSGPDCRFLSFKKSETVYVYYKLAGRRPDIWAGSVGSSFGYFPKNLLLLNHVYTDKELEVPAEETDFVCFDSGYDKFDSYDIDLLLGLDTDSVYNGTADHFRESENKQREAQPSEEVVIESENQFKNQDFSEDNNKVPDNQSASLTELDTPTDSPFVKDAESNTKGGIVEPKQELKPAEEHGSNDGETQEGETESELSKKDFVPDNEPITISKEVQIPKIQTTLGTTFDAVTTDEEITSKVTPEEEEPGKDLEEHPEDGNNIEEIPLLPFIEEKEGTPDFLTKDESSPPIEEATNETEEKTMWTSFGDAMFSVVTGGETTGGDVSSDEEDEDFEEEMPEKTENEALSSEPQEETVLSDGEDEDDLEEVEEEEDVDDTLKQTNKPWHNQTEERIEDPASQDDSFSNPEREKAETELSLEPTQNEEEKLVFKEPEVEGNDANSQDGNVIREQVAEYSVVTQGFKDMDHVPETNQPNHSAVEDGDKIGDEKVTYQTRDQLVADLVNVEQSEQESQIQKQRERRDEEIDAKTDHDHVVEEELLEDENALSFSQSTEAHTDSVPEPEYSDSIMRLTILRDHFSEENIARVQKLLGLKNLFRIEFMFSDLDAELQATRMSHTGTTEEIEGALETILETSENTILNAIEKMFDNQDVKPEYDNSIDTSSLDEETELLDDFQELAFSLRKKYSTVSDSAPLATEKPLDNLEELAQLDVKEDMAHMGENKLDNILEPNRDDNLTLTDEKEQLDEPATIEEDLDLREVKPEVKVEEDWGRFHRNREQTSFSPSDETEKTETGEMDLKETTPGPEVIVKEDSGHHSSRDAQLSSSPSDEVQMLPDATHHTPWDVDPGANAEHLASGFIDSVESVPQEDNEIGLFSTGIVLTSCVVSVMRNKSVEWTTVIISLLPEEWKPGETLYGCPWQAVFFTLLVGFVTFTLFFWRTVLAIKKKEYLVDEQKLREQIQALIKEKNHAESKISELQKQTEELKEKQKQSKATVSGTAKKMQKLESKVLEVEKQNEEMMEERNKYAKLLEEERTACLQNETRIEKLEQSNEKLQISRKKIQDAYAKTTIILDEAKIREDARNAQHKCLEKDFAALKEENKTLQATIKTWEGKHTELSEKIKVYQKSHKELEDAVVLKDHNVEVLSELLVDLDACDLQKDDTIAVLNGNIPADKKTAIRSRIKQMMDVSRIQTTLNVVEEERDRFMAKLLNEEKSRKELEEQHQELEHAIGALKSEKNHVENQFRILQQKNEIMVEMYQQKENALQQRLTKEELERQSKESMLSEVGGKAVEAEEQVKLLRQRINEMDEQMRKTEEVYKEQIKEQENKTHSNWVNARNAERALSQEKLEGSKLREKLAILTSQLNERRAPLFRPNSGQHAGPRQGDSYGPSPVSGGAPSPPIMIEGPRRPPSAPVGRRIDPYGPRPPSDPHGRYPDNKHLPGMDMTGPRSSSPANMDGPTEAVEPEIKGETVASTESPEPGPGSFIASPIRDSPGSMAAGPPLGPGPHDPFLPPGPHGRLPPPGPYRAPRPGTYLPQGLLPLNLPPPLPANGHPGMPLPGPAGGEFGPRPSNGHVFLSRPGPGPLMDPRGLPLPHFRPPPPHHFGPMPPLHGVRGPLGPRPPFPADMRFPGPRDQFGPAMDLPPGVPPHPARPGNIFVRAAPGDPQNSAGAPSGPDQDLPVMQEAPQDSSLPEMAQP